MAAVSTLAAKRYAQAAFELALEESSVDAWASAIEQMAAFMSEADVRRVLENSRVAQETKQQLVAAGLENSPPLALNLARLLAKKGRTALAGAIATEFGRLAEAQKHITRARALTAVPMGDTQREALLRLLRERTGGDVVLETDIDPSLLGGVVVQIADRLVDASTLAKLRSLRQNLVGAVG